MGTAVDLADPDTFVAGVPHEALAALRRTQPVYFQEMDGEPGFWAVLRHADVVRVAREPNLFSASEGGVVVENLRPEQLVTPTTPRPRAAAPASTWRCTRSSSWRGAGPSPPGRT